MSQEGVYTSRANAINQAMQEHPDLLYTASIASYNPPPKLYLSDISNAKSKSERNDLLSKQYNAGEAKGFEVNPELYNVNKKMRQYQEVLANEFGRRFNNQIGAVDDRFNLDNELIRSQYEYKSWEKGNKGANNTFVDNKAQELQGRFGDKYLSQGQMQNAINNAGIDGLSWDDYVTTLSNYRTMLNQSGNRSTMTAGANETNVANPESEKWGWRNLTMPYMIDASPDEKGFINYDYLVNKYKNSAEAQEASSLDPVRGYDYFANKQLGNVSDITQYLQGLFNEASKLKTFYNDPTGGAGIQEIFNPTLDWSKSNKVEPLSPEMMPQNVYEKYIVPAQNDYVVQGNVKYPKRKEGDPTQYMMQGYSKYFESKQGNP